MTKKALLKDTFREMRKSLGRFISIFMIVGIGVAFFAGVKASVPDMKGSADKYFDDYNLMDIKVMSTIGMSKEDVQALTKVNGVNGVYGSYSMDVVNMRHNQMRVFKLMSMPLDTAAENKNYINQARVIEGRLPKKKDECVIEKDAIRQSGMNIGDKITFVSGTEDVLRDRLKRTTYTIVGKVNTPYYLSYEKGSSSIGSGEINNYAFIPEENFKGEYFTEIYLTLDNVKQLNSYDDAYFDIVKPVKKEVTSLVETKVADRFQDIRDKALRKIADGRKEYRKQKQKYDNEIAKAQQKLVDAQTALQDGQQELNHKKQTTAITFQEKEAELNTNANKLKKARQEYEKGKAEFAKQKKTVQQQLALLDKNIAQLQAQLQQLKQQKAALDAQLAAPDLSEDEKQILSVKQQEVIAGMQKLQMTLQPLQTQKQSAQTQLAQGEKKLTQSKQQIALGEQQLKQGKIQLAEAKKTAEREFASAQQTINLEKKELANGQRELNVEKKDGADKLKKAKEKLDQSEQDINDLKEPKTYVLDRHSHYSYMDYGSAADRMGAISKVFPLFFFLVAALVCLTTMTRMVDEQRQEIGTLKALGYTKAHIAMKYIIYASIASVCGGIFGAVIGMIIFPTVIYNAWGIMYNMPSVQLQAQIPLAATAILLASLITVAAAIMACYKELIEVPSQLMRPKAPKNGKKILMERIPFIWKHFNFIHKVTARNIFRYKKRFFMTVIGISGCTALLLAGFGIQDSIGEIAVKQYQEIYAFDMSMEFDSDITASQKEKLLKKVQSQDAVKEASSMAVYHGFYADSGEDKGIDLYVPSDVQQFRDYIMLRTRKGHELLTLHDDGAIITEKLAKMKHLSIGDTFAVDNGDGVKHKVKISGISENYVGHALYMTPSYYKKIYHRSASDTTVFAKLKTTNSEVENALGNTLMKEDNVSSLTFYSGIASSFEDTISSLSFVVVVLIISAGLLAFVVLYNLTNVNISERLREIATIKVLGFYDNEVSTYVYRENIVLTFIGSIAGIFVGIGLHALIMSLAELENVMFGRNIYPISFGYAVAITMLFAIMVNLVMYKKLKKIPMVESLKSIE